MKITPNINWLIYKSVSQLMLSAVAAVIPLILGVFYFGFMVKLGREMTVQDSSTLLYVYSLSLILIYVITLIKEYFYVAKAHISTEENGIVIYKSFIGQNKNNIPYVRISSVEVNQSAFDKMLGLGTLYVHTKNNDESYEISGLRYSDASGFADKIIKEYKLGIK